MSTIILVAHGQEDPGAPSNPKVKIITKAKQPLSFEEAIKYMKGGVAPEFPSVSLGGFTPLNDDDCEALFGEVPAAGPGYVNTGKRRGNDMKGYPIFALRGQDVSLNDIGIFADKYGKVILLACRNS